MKKLLLIFSIICINTLLFSQKVGIKTSNPQGAFHIDGDGDNPLTGGLPTSIAQQLDDFLIEENGNVNLTPRNLEGNKLNIFFSSSTDNNLRIQGLQPAPNPEDIDLLGAYTTGTGVYYLKREESINELNLPKTTMFVLNADVTNFLNGVSAGGAQDMPMTMIKNTITGLTYDPSTHFVTLPAGTYRFTVIYAASHAGCDLSSYFYDFPLPTSFTRVHNTSDHLTGAGVGSRHTGTITYVSASLPAGKIILINLGRGQSGNCSGAGMTLFSDGTQFLITRIGN
jgi:hypothetical protein